MKTFDRVWHKFLILKLPSNGCYPSLCTFISSFLFNCSIAAVVNGHCSSPKTTNSGFPQGSVLSPTVFVLFISDLLNFTQCSIYSYADDTTIYFSLSYNRRPTQQKLNDSRRDAIWWLTSDISLVSDWGRANLVLFNASKNQFLQLSTRRILLDNYLLLFNDIQMPLFSTLNTFGLSFSKILNWQFNIFSLAKSASTKLGVLWRLRPFFSASQLLTPQKGLICPSMEYGSHFWGDSTHTTLLNV